MHDFMAIQETLNIMVGVVFFGMILVILFYGFDKKRSREQEAERVRRENEREERLLQKLEELRKEIRGLNARGDG